MEIIKYHFYYLESQFVGFSLVIQITIFLMIVLAVIYLFSVSRIVSIARSNSIRTDRETSIKKKYEDKIRKILFMENELSHGQISQELDLNASRLKDWEKSYITELILNLIKQNEKANLNTN